MTADDAVRVDPATRALLYAAFGVGRDAGAAAGGDEVFHAWLAARFPPPLPPEPRDGAVIAGHGTDVWQREDDENADESSWYMTGAAEAHGWDEAVVKGADSTRRLVELPALDAYGTLDTIAAVISDATDAMHTEALIAARDVLRVLAERGNGPATRQCKSTGGAP